MTMSVKADCKTIIIGAVGIQWICNVASHLEIWKWDKLTAFEAETHTSHQFSLEENNLDKIRKKLYFQQKKQKKKNSENPFQSFNLFPSL